jgi:hypothetical protein
MTETGGVLPPQVHAASLHALVDVYVADGLAGGDLAALGPLRLLRDRVGCLLAEHARLAHDADGRPWSDGRSGSRSGG